MKTKALEIIVITLFVVSTSVIAQIKINSTTGYIGIGTSSPQNNVDIYNNVRFFSSSTSGIMLSYNGTSPIFVPLTNNTGYLGYYQWWYNANITNIYYVNLSKISDARLKENISELSGSNSLEKIKKIKCIKFDYKPGFLNSTKDSLNKCNSSYSVKNQLGFLGQQLDSIVPEAVTFDSLRQVFGVKYDNLVPLVIAAIKQQQQQIDSLKKLINKKGTVSMTSSSIQTNVTITESDVPALYQNAPNPFSQKTVIGYYLPETVQNATIYVYDMNGGQIKSIPIFSKGAGNVTINGNELRPGMYLYTLIANRQEIATKRMILTQ